MGSLPTWVKIGLIVLGVGLLGAVTWYLRQNKMLASVSASPLPTSLASPVQPKQQYTNPLDKGAQYTNPFGSYQNPFSGLK